MKRSTRKSYDRIFERFRDAFEGTDKYLQDKSELTSDLKNINFFATQVFEHCFPSDINRLKKIMWFPLIEAALELEYSVFFAKAGIYKVAYMCLRNFMELSLVYFFYVLSAKSRGNAWVKGNVPTPFKREILAVLFENEDFQKFDNDMHIKNAINQIYSDLSDICHTRGQPCSHLNMSRANFPQFIEESLKAFLQKTKDVINIVITCFAGVNPIILFPIPIQEKFGMGGPLGGFLEEYQVSVLHKLLKPEFLDFLLKRYESDTGVMSLRQHFEDLPDITDEDFKKQIEEFDKSMKAIEPKDDQNSV